MLKMGRKLMGKLIYPCFAYKIGKILIDTGTKMAERELLAYLSSDPPEIILITHGDEDHIGNLKAIQDRFDVVAYGHPGVVDFVENPEMLKLLWYQRFAWGKPASSSCEVLKPGEEYLFDDKRIVPISTPGHRDHHLSFYFPEAKWVFTGDIYCGRRVRTYFPYENFYHLQNSISELNELDLEKIFCAFRGMIDEPHHKLSAKLDYMNQLQADVLELEGKGFSTNQISRKIFGREPLLSTVTSGDMKHQHLINSILEDKDT